MTNPHALFKATSLTVSHILSSSTSFLANRERLCGIALGLLVLSASVGTSQAQSVEALEWQPGQSMLPTVISTPHNDVRKLLRQAKYAPALQLVNKNLATNPRDPQMRFWQAYLFEQLGQPDMAQQVYLDLTREHPELAEPFNNLGVIYAAKGDYPNAKAALDSALRANPSYAAAHENMGDLLVNMARQSYAQALATGTNQRGVAQKVERLKPVLDMTQGKP